MRKISKLMEYGAGCHCNVPDCSIHALSRKFDVLHDLAVTCNANVSIVVQYLSLLLVPRFIQNLKLGCRGTLWSPLHVWLYLFMILYEKLARLELVRVHDIQQLPPSCIGRLQVLSVEFL